MNSLFEEMVISFSIISNTKSLLKPLEDRNQSMSCIHGVRSLAAISIIIGHVFFFQHIPMTSPYMARQFLVKMSDTSPLMQFGRNAFVYVDIFFFVR